MIKNNNEQHENGCSCWLQSTVPTTKKVNTCLVIYNNYANQVIDLLKIKPFLFKKIEYYRLSANPKVQSKGQSGVLTITGVIKTNAVLEVLNIACTVKTV